MKAKPWQSIEHSSVVIILFLAIDICGEIHVEREQCFSLEVCIFTKDDVVQTVHLEQT